MAGLVENGRLDDDTMAMMRTPRCGIPDMDRNDDDFNGNAASNSNSNDDNQQLLSIAGKVPNFGAWDVKGDVLEEELEAELADPRKKRRRRKRSLQPEGMDSDVDEETGSGRRSRRFALSGRKWRKTDLTYRVERYTTRLTRDEVDRTIEKALNFWAALSGLTFTRLSSGPVDIAIVFQV